jgi:solute:Na+ symporter, SSS family
MSLLIFFTIIFFFIYWGFKSSAKVQDDSSYLLANRKTSLLALVATLVMTEFNTSTLLAFAGFGYTTGIWGLCLPLVFLVGLGFYTLTVAKKWKRFNAISVAELFSLRYGNGFGKFVSLLLIISMIGFSATYVKSLMFLFQPFVPELNSYILSAGLVILVLLITLRGGLVSIIQTDLISFFATMILLPMIFYFSYSGSEKGFMGLVDTFPTSSSENLPIRFIASLILITMFTYISAPWYGQKIFAALDEKTAFKAVGISSILVFLFYSLPLLGVAFLRVNGVIGILPETAIPTIIKSYFPEWLVGFGFAILFLIGATTLSGVWSALVTMIVGDFVLSKKAKIGKDYQGSIQLTVIFAVLSWLLANLFVDSILDKMILANIPIAAISFALLAGFYCKRATTGGAILSTIAGIIWGGGCYIHLGESGGYTWFWAIYGIPLIFVSGIVGSYLFPKSKAEEVLFTEFQERMK